MLWLATISTLLAAFWHGVVNRRWLMGIRLLNLPPGSAPATRRALRIVWHYVTFHLLVLAALLLAVACNSISHDAALLRFVALNLLGYIVVTVSLLLRQPVAILTSPQIYLFVMAALAAWFAA